MPRRKKQVVEIKKGESTRGVLVLGISWGISIVSLVAFGGLLIYVLTGKFTLVNDSETSGANVNVNANANTNIEDLTNTNSEKSKIPPEPLQADFTKISPVNEEDYIRGEEDAVITLIEFADFQCPFCLRFEDTLDKIFEEYKDKVRLVYRHFLLASIHPNAQNAAEAAECAGEQGKFWEMHDLLFENQNALTVVDLKNYAKDLGLDLKDFNECFDSSKYASKIQNQIKEAINAGVTGTPTTFVNGVLIKSAIPYEQLKLIIEQILEE